MPAPASAQISGLGRVLVAVYGVLALAATGRSLVQIVSHFDDAPLAYSLSAFAAGVYALATVALVRSTSGAWYAVAWAAIGVELAGVLVVGTYSLFRPDLFPDETVWSWFGAGYVFIPLILPFVGLWWLVAHRPGRVVPAAPIEELEGPAW